jgi:hypothetical protein
MEIDGDIKVSNEDFNEFAMLSYLKYGIRIEKMLPPIRKNLRSNYDRNQED